VADDFAARYAGLLAGSYDCVDRIVLNAYHPMGNTAGGFRTWWRLQGLNCQDSHIGCLPGVSW